jgi:hypothetical protein
MKAKKAIKRLNRVETLLGTVIDEFSASTKQVRELLDGAKVAVATASQALAAAPAKKPLVRAGETQPSRLSDAARKRLSVAAKKRWSEAKRKGLTSLAKPKHKTA